MQIKIKEINGSEFTIELESSQTVAVLKSKIEETKAIPAIEIKLLFSGKVLQDEKTLEDYKVSETSKIMLTRVKVDLKVLIQKALMRYYDSEKGEFWEGFEGFVLKMV
jgi:ubiquitin-like protein Nedd8